MGKTALTLNYFEVAPILMELAGIKKGHGAEAQLARALGIEPQSITNFKNRNKLPTDRVLLFWIKNNLPMERLEELLGEKMGGKKKGMDKDGWKKESLGRKHDGDGLPGEVTQEHPAASQHMTDGRHAAKPVEGQRWGRREEDIHYSQVPAIREHGPEWSGGRQILKLFLLKPAFGPTCNLDKLHFIIQQESNFHPSIPAGTILVVDTNNVKITSALYIFRYGGDSLALRQLDPIDDQTVRVTTGTTPSSESRDMPLEKVKPLIVGRVVWAVFKI